MRLQKFMAHAGAASRRKSEELIKEGRVKVNNNIVTEMGLVVDPNKDRVYPVSYTHLTLPTILLV